MSSLELKGTIRAAALLIAFIPMAAVAQHPATAAHSEEHVEAAAEPIRQIDDRAAVTAAVEDYLKALYDVAPERIARSVDPDLVKLGFHRGEDGEYKAYAMTYDQLYDLAGRWNVDNRRNITAETIREITVLDVLDKTASAKLVAQWGIDYLHLAKSDGRWKITQVLWQSHPAAAALPAAE